MLIHTCSLPCCRATPLNVKDYRECQHSPYFFICRQTFLDEKELAISGKKNSVWLLI